MDLHDAVRTYFDGEKNAGLILGALGVVVLAGAAIFLQARWGLRSFGVTLLVWGLVQVAIGVGLYWKTGPQMTGLLAQLGQDAPRFLVDEGARMAKVQRNFVLLEYGWIALAVAASIVAVAMKKRFVFSGVALGMLINVSLLLAFDLVAERRGAVYLSALTRG